LAASIHEAVTTPEEVKKGAFFNINDKQITKSYIDMSQDTLPHFGANLLLKS
jgi:hypothetical protein